MVERSNDRSGAPADEPGPTDAASRPGPPSFATKMSYGVGQVAEGIKNNAFDLILFFYYNQVLGLPGTLCGLAMAIALMVDAFTDPMAGSLSDGLGSRWGRRHPFMYASAIPLGIFFFALFQPPDGLGTAGLALWFTVFTVLTRVAMTLYHVPHLALGAELSDDYQERTRIVVYRVVFGILGVLLVSVVGVRFFFPSTPEYPKGQLDPEAYGLFALSAAVVMAATILLSAWGTHGTIRQLPRPPRDLPRFTLARLGREMSEALENGSFRALFFGMTVFFVARGLTNILNLHVSTHFWNLEAVSISWIMLAIVVGLVVGIPVWARVAHRLDKRNTFLVGGTLFVGFHAVPIVMKLWFWYPPADSPLYLGIILCCAFVAAFGMAAPVITSPSMLADIADEHELRSGRRQEGIFFGAHSFAAKGSSGFGQLLAGMLLDLIAFPASALPGTVPEETIRQLAVLFGPGLTLFGVTSIYFLARYSLTREKHRAIQQRLELRRATVTRAGGVRDSAVPTASRPVAPAAKRSI